MNGLPIHRKVDQWKFPAISQILPTPPLPVDENWRGLVIQASVRFEPYPIAEDRQRPASLQTLLSVQRSFFLTLSPFSG